MVNGKGFRRKGSWLNWSAVPEFVWGGWVKPWNTTVGLSRVVATIWTSHCPHTRQRFHCLGQPCFEDRNVTLSTLWDMCTAVKVVPFYAMKACRRNGGIAPLLNVGTKWRCFASCTPQSLHPQERTAGPVNRRMDGLQSLSGRFGEAKHLLYLPGFEHGTLQSVAYLLNWLRCSSSWCA